MSSPFNALPFPLASGAGLQKQTIVNGTSPVTIIPAFVGNANPRINGTHVDIIGIEITSSNSASAELTIADGAGTQYTLQWTGTSPLIQTPVILQQQANSAWTLTASANANGFNVTVFYQIREAYESF